MRRTADNEASGGVDILGDVLVDERGQVTGTRVLPSEGWSTHNGSVVPGDRPGFGHGRHGHGYTCLHRPGGRDTVWRRPGGGDDGGRGRGDLEGTGGWPVHRARKRCELEGS